MQINIPYIVKVRHYIRQLQDIRVAGQLLFVVIVLLVSWSGVKSIQTNYGLQKQIATLQQQNQVAELQNKNLALENDYLNSNQYLELSARQNFSLAAPGEKELIVPESVALTYTVDMPAAKTVASPVKQSAPQHNFTAWVNFFLHRPHTSD